MVRFPSRLLLLVFLTATMPALAYDLNDTLSIGGILAATAQCQDVSARLPGEGYGQAIPDTDPQEFDTALDGFDNTCRGGMPVQLEIDFHPTEQDQFFVALGWAVDNSLNEVSPWRLAPWAADLEADVEDINGKAYYRASINERFAITADLQYMSDDLDQSSSDQEPRGLDLRSATDGGLLSNKTPDAPRGRASPSRDCSPLCLMTSPSLSAVTQS